MADRVGTQLGNYRLTRLLGQGGFAEVYLGEHIYLKTPAALKVLDTELSASPRSKTLLPPCSMPLWEPQLLVPHFCPPWPPGPNPPSLP